MNRQTTLHMRRLGQASVMQIKGQGSQTIDLANNHLSMRIAPANLARASTNLFGNGSLRIPKENLLMGSMRLKKVGNIGATL